MAKDSRRFAFGLACVENGEPHAGDFRREGLRARKPSGVIRLT